MFSNLVSYLGYAAPSSKTSGAENTQKDVRLRAVEEDEWVLVERDEKEVKATKNDVDEDSEMTRVTLVTSTYPSNLPNGSKAPSRSASLDILNPLQESWYLTPPPSFTSEGPVHMETSPLENLLIEHPSMSVYEHSQRTETAKKMSNSSPSATATSKDEHPLMSRPIREIMGILPRNKLNVKLSKKKSSPAPMPTKPNPGESKEQIEAKEPAIKSFVKSPRRSINSELQSLSKKSPRKRSESSIGKEMISKTSLREDIIREDKSPAIPNAQTRRLYSEVLASKPKISAVQSQPTSPSEPESAKPDTKPEPVSIVPETPEEESVSRLLPDESIMSVEENVDEDSEPACDKDRRKVVQTLPDRQHRLHFLNRTSQKMEQRKTCDYVKKNLLIRTNKAREFNFRNKRQRRADMMQRHSGANNNRKCAKTALY